MRELVLPTTRLHAALLDCRRDWGPGLHEDGFGIGGGDDLDSAAGFEEWVQGRLSLTHPAGAPCPPQRHGSPRWIVEDGQVVGAIALRHIPDDDVGQIGYGVRPSARRRGVASWALGEILLEARAALDVDRVLAVCLDGNIASARSIESRGGVFDRLCPSADGLLRRRYWLAL